MDRPSPAPVTIGLLDGSTKVGVVFRFSPGATDLVFESPPPSSPIAALPQRVLLPAEQVAYVAFHRDPSSTGAPRSQPGLVTRRVHTAGGRTFTVETEDDEAASRIGFHGVPALADSPFKEIYFYNHGVHVTQDVEPLGAMLVRGGLVEPAAIERGLAAQKVPVGQILIEQRKVSPSAVAAAAALQKRQPLRIGEILIDAGLATPEDIDKAVAEQQVRAGRRIGEILVDMAVLTEVELLTTLSKKFHLQVVDLDTYQIDPEAAQGFPAALLATHGVLPIDADSKGLTVATSDPLAVDALDALRLHTPRPIHQVLALPSQLRRCIAEQARRPPVERRPDHGTMEVILQELVADDPLPPPPPEIGPGSGDGAVIKLVNQIIIEAARRGASDIHVEPNGRERPTVVRFRIDGDCIHYKDIPPGFRHAVTARLKIMAQLDIAERRKPQDGKISFKLRGSPIGLRVATIPTAEGEEDVVLRILAASKPLPLDEMGLSERNLVALRAMILKPHGLVLCVGPTGSGKTTTLHSALGAINTVDRKIWTAEDPVEIMQAGLRQVQVNPKIDFTFAHAMRAFLRADPDVIMVGEMRDRETAAVALEASLTGHLVLSTLHTNSAAETIARLLDMGLDPVSFAEALQGVLAQRLGRSLCKSCRAARAGTRHEYDEIAHVYGAEALEKKLGVVHGPDFLVWSAEGCDACSGSGYKGRLGLHELLVTSGPIKRAIFRRAPAEEIRELSIEEGMTTLLQDGIEKALRGLTDLTQVLAVCVE